jgi:parallel beta-helix repeat protein
MGFSSASLHHKTNNYRTQYGVIEGEGNMKRLFAAILLMILAFGMFASFRVLPAKSSPGTITVPDDYPTIQAAINAASPGDTIFVRAGFYHENLILQNRPDLRLIGELGADLLTSTVIYSANINEDVIFIESSSPNVTVSKFYVEGAPYSHSGILVLSSGCVISDNVITQNSFGLLIGGNDSKITGNIVAHNNNGGIYISFSSRNTLRNNTIYRNGYNFGIGHIQQVDEWGPQDLWCCLQDIDTSNTVDGKPIIFLVNVTNAEVTGNAGYVGIVNSSSVTVSGLDLSGNAEGLFLAYTNDSVVSHTFFSNNMVGANLMYNRNCSIEQSSFGSNGAGIHVHHSNYTDIHGNNLSSQSWGNVNLIYSDYTKIENNNIDGSLSRTVYGWGTTGIYMHKSNSSTIAGNNVSKLSCGISLSFANDNQIYHNNFQNNTHQVFVNSSNCVWDDGYPYGGNFWSDYWGVDHKMGPNQDQAGSDGLGDTPYMIDSNNVDRYPLMVSLPPELKTSDIWASITSISGSSLADVPLNTYYLSPYSGRDFSSLVCIPENTQINLWCKGHLYDDQQNPIVGKEVRLLVDGAAISSISTNDQTYNANWTIKLSLASGFHNGELKFVGDTQFSSSSYKFTILVYRNLQFNMTKDAFSFINLQFSFDEFVKLVQKLLQENVIDQTLELPFLILFPLTSAGGHCFGMAACSSEYFLNPSFKPKAVDTYELSTDDALMDIDWYQLCGLGWKDSETSVTSSISEMKSLIDSGTPVILGIKEAKHAITIIGYYDDSDETFLIAYDSERPNSMLVYSVKDGKLIYGSTNVTSAVLIDAHALPQPYHPTELLKSIFKKYFGVQVHSPVDIKIVSASGKVLLIENNTVVRNEIDDSYVYLAESKIILLPSKENYTMEATGKSDGQVSLDCVFTSGDQIVVHQSQNITISNGSRLYLLSPQSGVIYLDSNGDGTIDQTIAIPEFSSSFVMLLLMHATLLTVGLFKRRRRKLVSKAEHT